MLKFRDSNNHYYIHTEIYAPESIEIKIVSSRWRSQLLGHTFFSPVRKKEDNEEYERNSLRAFFASFERYLKKKKTVDLAS